MTERLFLEDSYRTQTAARVLSADAGGIVLLYLVQLRIEGEDEAVDLGLADSPHIPPDCEAQLHGQSGRRVACGRNRL